MVSAAVLLLFSASGLPASAQADVAPDAALLALPLPPEAGVTLAPVGLDELARMEPSLPQGGEAPAAPELARTQVAPESAGDNPAPEPETASLPRAGAEPLAALPAVVEPVPVPAVAQTPAPAAVMIAPLALEPVPEVPPVSAALALNGPLQRALELRAREEPPRAGAALPSSLAVLRKDREAILAFYAARQFAPLWIADARFNEVAGAVLSVLDHAADDGLDLRLTPVPTLAAGADAARQVAAEIALSEAVVGYGRQASGARINPQHISILITAKPDVAEAAHILASASAAGKDAGQILQAFNPPQKAYADLKAKLLELRRAQKPVAARIAPGPILRVGMRDPRVPLIRARFGLDTAPAPDPADIVYDVSVANAVADFQRANGLPASGILTARTIAALSGGEPARLENEILANMERWRWEPRHMGQDRIEVNVPDFTARLMAGDKVVYETRVVVGKPDTPTPIFSNTMQFLIINPYWNVPQSIIKKEMMPRLAADPDYLHRLGYEVIQKGHTLIVRQPPGERNALGRIKFMFPNEHAVYLHDTPSRALFANSFRAYSHGCVRVDQPFRFAEAVLGAGWSEARIRGMIGGPERRVDMAKPLPIHIEYFTAVVDETGRLQLRDDVYGYSRRLKIAMGLEA